jgi:hypothetical protein
LLFCYKLRKDLEWANRSFRCFIAMRKTNNITLSDTIYFVFRDRSGFKQVDVRLYTGLGFIPSQNIHLNDME